MKFLLAVNRHEVQNHWSFLYFKDRRFQQKSGFAMKS